MIEVFLKELGILGTGLLVLGGITKLTWKADEALADEPRLALGKILRGIEIRQDVEGWPDIFARMFDRVFGQKHLSSQCFLRSCLASLLSFAVMTLVWWTVTPNDAWVEWDWQDEKFIILLFLGSVAVMINMLPGYVSLLETRAVLRFMGGRAARTAAVLGLDAIATCLIFWACFVVTLGVFSSWFTGNFLDRWEYVLDEFFSVFTFSASPEILGIFFYATFFTSVWLWLYALAYGMMLAARKVGPAIRLLQVLLPLETKPLRSLGLVSGGIGCIGYWTVGLLFIVPA